MARERPAPTRRRRRRSPPESGAEKVTRAGAEALEWVQYIGLTFVLLGLLGILVALTYALALGHGWSNSVATAGLGAGFGLLLLGSLVFAIGHTFRLR